MSFVNPLSTLKIIVTLGKDHLGISNLPPTHPAMPALYKYFRLNALTAQMNDDFSGLPNISRMRENVDAMLGKLRLVASDPNLAKTDGPEAQKEYTRLTTLYKGPSEKTKELLDKREQAQKQYEDLKEEEHEKIENFVQRIIGAGPTATSIAGGEAMLKTFSDLEARRAQIQTSIKSIKEELVGTYDKLAKIFKETRTAIPSQQRPPLPPDHDTPRQEY